AGCAMSTMGVLAALATSTMLIEFAAGSMAYALRPWLPATRPRLLLASITGGDGAGGETVMSQKISSPLPRFRENSFPGAAGGVWSSIALAAAAERVPGAAG